MNGFSLIRSAIGNTLRSKTRTLLTVIAIVIGAFTLTLTSGVGTGINAYIDQTVSSIGAADVMTVAKTVETAEDTTGPQVYDPNAAESVAATGRGPGAPAEVEAITPTDIDELSKMSGVLSIEPNLAVSPDYVQFADGPQYQAEVGSFVPGMTLELAAGEQPTRDTSDYQVALPVAYVEPLGYTDNDAAVGSTVAIGITAADGTKTAIDATVVGISEEGLIGGGTLSLNPALTEALFEAQSVGLNDTERTSYAEAVVRFDAQATDADTTALKDRLSAAGYTGTTVNDQIGSFRTIIDAVVLVLNGFAIIALLAAGFGIVNTLLMSVQERTREIGLMKAIGMPGRNVFSLFSAEAVFIGLLGSAIGAGLAIIGGTLANGLLSGSLLSGLPGLQIVAFDPFAISIIVLTVMGIAFLAGTTPALRAARLNPIEALRYE